MKRRRRRSRREEEEKEREGYEMREGTKRESGKNNP